MSAMDRLQRWRDGRRSQPHLSRTPAPTYLITDQNKLYVTYTRGLTIHVEPSDDLLAFLEAVGT